MPKATSTTSQTGKTAAELPIQTRLRLEHAGRWVAWSDDYNSVITVGDDPETVREAARQTGAERSILEWISPVPTRPIEPGA